VDRGREMAEHAVFTEQTGCPVYFCDPRSPWRRGANENRLLRQYLTKHADLRVHNQAALDAIADKINARPRHVLG
jgi:IS30 family transposase